MGLDKHTAKQHQARQPRPKPAPEPEQTCPELSVSLADLAAATCRNAWRVLPKLAAL